MSGPRNVLDGNLARLLTRAYAPVTARAEFRAALKQRLERELAPRGAPRAVRVPDVSRPRVRWLRLAAAVLVCAAIGVFAVRAWKRPGAPSWDTLLAQGEIAVRETDGAWRALDERERANGVEHAGGQLELATPAGAGVAVWLAGAGSVVFEERTRAAVDATADGGTLALDLQHGALALERLAAGDTWRAHTSQGDFELARGRLELAYVGPELARGGRSVRARLVWGAATFLADGGALELAPGDARIVRGGRATEFAPLADSGGRTNAASANANAGAPTGTPAPADATAAGKAASATLSVELALPAGRTLAGPWSLTTMRDVRLPNIGEPHTRACAQAETQVELGELVPGSYALYATLPGFGCWRAHDVVLGAGERLAIVITAAEPARARGRVLDARDGSPIEGAYVVSETDAPASVLPFDFTVETESGWEAWACLARTNADGVFDLAQLSAGRHVLRVTAPGRAAAWSAPLELAAGARTDELVLQLGEPGHIDAVLSRATRAAAERRPATGPRPPLVIASRVDVDVPRRIISYGCALESAAGRVTIADLPPGLYVVFEIDGHRASPSMRQVVVRAGRATEVVFGDGERGALLTGTLRFADGSPAAGVDLSLMPAGSAHLPSGAGERWVSERSDAQGRFSFPALEPGTYEIYAGHGVGTHFAVVGRFDVPDVNAFSHDIVLANGTVSGSVLRADGGAALASAQVIAERDVDGVWTFAGRWAADGSGRWSAEFLAPGRLRFTAFAPIAKLAPATSAPIELRADLSTVERVALALPAGAELALVARDTAGGVLAGVVLELVGPDGARQRFSRDDETGADGRFDVLGIEAGRWTIRAKREGFAPVERTIDLYTGERHELELVLATSVPK